MRRLLVLVVGVSALLAGSAAAQQCDLKPPAGPAHPGAHFDWRPLARNWCDQLKACGYKYPGCVADYVQAARRAAAHAPAAAAGGPVTQEVSTTVKLKCEDTEEHRAGTLSCGRDDRRPRRRRNGP
jgi:hypothetical protein